MAKRRKIIPEKPDTIGVPVVSPEEMQQYKGLENLTEDQALELDKQLKQFAMILLKAIPPDKIKELQKLKEQSHAKERKS